METNLENTSLELLDECGIHKLPVDLHAIMEHQNILYQEEALDDELSGFCAKKGKNGSITVNSTHHSNRQRFTIAHEIGHLVLHCSGNESLFIDKQVFNRDHKSGLGESVQEVEANRFASCLLMPEPFIIKSLLNIKGILKEEHIHMLASEYEVSAMAMCYRLNKLGHINFFI